MVHYVLLSSFTVLCFKANHLTQVVCVCVSVLPLLAMCAHCFIVIKSDILRITSVDHLVSNPNYLHLNHCGYPTYQWCNSGKANASLCLSVK